MIKSVNILNLGKIITGDPLSSMLFITSVDVLHVLLRNVVDNGLIEGLVGI
jgi:hypothetical protein